jgi:hypothetical protein
MAAPLSVGEYVEVPVTVDGEPRTAIGVIRDIIVPDGGGDPIAHVDFGTGTQVENTTGTAVLWKGMAELKRVTKSGVKEAVEEVATTGGDHGHEKVDKSGGAGKQYAGDAQHSAKPSGAHAVSTKRPPPIVSPVVAATLVATAATEHEDDTVVPTVLDQAVWTVVAGPYAILSVRRPLVTVAFLLVFTCAKSLYATSVGIADDPTKLHICERLLVARELGPTALHSVVHGQVPDDLLNTIRDPAATLKTLHASIERSQRSAKAPASAPAAPVVITQNEKAASTPPVEAPLPSVLPATKAPEASETPKKKKKGKKNKELATSDAAVPPVGTPVAEVVVVLPQASIDPQATPQAPPAAVTPVVTAASAARVTFSAAEREYCGTASVLLQHVTWLLLLSSVSAFTFTNPRVELGRFAKKYKPTCYISFFMVCVFAALKSGLLDRDSFAADSGAADFVFTQVVPAYTVSMFAVEQIAFNSLLGLIGVVIGFIASHPVAMLRTLRSPQPERRA